MTVRMNDEQAKALGLGDLIPKRAVANATGRHTFVVEGWTPPSVNKLWKQGHWAVGNRLKRQAKEAILRATCPPAAFIPAAAGKRRVSVSVTIAGRGGTPDPDNVLKVLLDAIKANRLLIDDSATWCEIGDVVVERGTGRRTTIILEDI